MLDGSRVASASRDYELTSAGCRSVEVPVSVYWQAFREVVAKLLCDPVVDPQGVEALGISAQGETLVILDEHDEPLRNAIVWLDSRASDEAVELEDKFNKGTVYETTGQPGILPTWPASKVLWLARHEVHLWEQARRVLLLEDYFILRLTGEAASEGSLATSTCYWDFRKKDWWDAMLDVIGLRRESLPDLVEPGTAVGRIRQVVAEELGLPSRTQVCTGALDQACAAIGGGNIAPGILSESTGTAVAICATLAQPRLDPEMRMPCHYHGIPSRYMFHSFTSGGVLLRWMREEIWPSGAGTSPTAVYDAMTSAAERVAPGAEGLVVLPHLQGAMAPESNAEARAAFVGLSLGHHRSHLIRAALESIAFVIRRNVEVIEELGVPVTSIIALGGGARSPLWKQIEADVTHRPVTTTLEREAAVLGACILAGGAIGRYNDIAEATAEMVRPDKTYHPDPRNEERYDDIYGSYRATYEALLPIFSRRSLVSHV